MQDVAFIFRKLEQSAVENAFVVYVKDNKPIVHHLSMGDNVSTMIWFSAIADGVSRFSPDKVYFIHNHSTGSIEPSDADVRLHLKLSETFGNILQDSIIIDIDSGYFSTYNCHSPSKINTFEKPQNTVELNVLKFDTSVFHKNIDHTFVTSQLAVASLVASQRLSYGDKLSVLILGSDGHVNANLHLPYSDFSNENLVKDIAAYSGRFNGTGIIFYGRSNNIEMFNQVQEVHDKLKGINIILHDVLNFKSSPEIFHNRTEITKDDYFSYKKEGLLEVDYRNAINKAENLFNKYNAGNLATKTKDINTDKDEIIKIKGNKSFSFNIDFDINSKPNDKGMSM